MSYELHAELESSDRVISLKMNTMAEARHFVDEMEKHDLWPEGAEAVIQHLYTGATWMYADVWEPSSYTLYPLDGQAALAALTAVLELEGGQYTDELRERVEKLILNLGAWLEGHEMPDEEAS